MNKRSVLRFALRINIALLVALLLSSIALSPALAATAVAPKITSLPSPVYGQVGVPMSVGVRLTGIGGQAAPVPTFTILFANPDGVRVNISAKAITGSTTFAATVSAIGTPLKAGIYILGIKVSNAVGSDTQYFTVIIGTPPVAVTGVSVSPATAFLTPGNTVYLTAALSPANATNQVVLWSSSNTAVATVDPSGLVTAVGDGTATLTATTQDGNKTSTSTVTVTTPTPAVHVSSVEVAPGTLSMDVNGTYTLNLLVHPQNVNSNFTVDWSSSNPAVASVAADGTVVALSAGTSTITATVNEGGSTFTASCPIEVKPPVIPVSGIVISPKTLSLYTGGTAYLSAILEPVNATNQVVTWSSSSSDIAVVDNSGLVTTKKAGTVTISAIAQDGNYSDSATLTITDKVINIPVSSVTLSPSSLALNAGETRLLVATVLPANATNQNVTWSTSNPTVASIAPDGTLTSLSAGDTVITVTTQDGNKTATCSVTVLNVTPVIHITSISVTPSSVTLPTGGTRQLNAALVPANATNPIFTWSSSNPAVAAVSSTGLVTGITAGGPVTITATTQDGGKTDTCIVTVTPPATIRVDDVEVHPDSLELDIGAKATLTATINPANATDQQVSWSSSRPSVASVTQDGTVTALATGTARITVTTHDGGKTATCEVKVKSNVVQPESVVLYPTSAKIQAGENLLISFDIEPSDATNKTVTWNSSNTSVAAVDSTGLVTALQVGTATITATTQLGNKTATCAVTVIAKTSPIPVTDVRIDPSALLLYIGDKAIVNALIKPSNATNQQVTWSSTAPLVASVAADGTVIALSPGKALIKVTTKDGNKTDTCEVTVKTKKEKSDSLSGNALSAPADSSADETEQSSGCNSGFAMLTLVGALGVLVRKKK